MFGIIVNSKIKLLQFLESNKLSPQSIQAAEFHLVLCDGAKQEILLKEGHSAEELEKFFNTLDCECKNDFSYGIIWFHDGILANFGDNWSGEWRDSFLPSIIPIPSYLKSGNHIEFAGERENEKL